ncbi:MAG: bifunctional glutamate N-acetyltransferase/amino-acid acetyltransferase ArgJ [Proteobacteria bacterium]|jgi:glutamate N-acetyltransferase / amino-acid N-acetyltransferase|nr:bifunctional glutamate N-acetyltransferase/amino-acid acetyltransferase ArgJ [Pseudomonadota bacterium]MBT5819158.1 bifunctional glutamate N-acetyltransferase/amino-acid acetyltransferase ArgJ [Pseudomonadota bacterium]MBT6348174.1 bifunctional glutamate N-acetyltransferase/amino-acid acetyltransferase ArgJ [Pseudomonadota bacterium]
MPAIAGVSLQVARARIKYAGRDDLLLVTLHRGTSVAGVFTRSATASAPVQWSKKVAASGKARAILINSGNANTFTGVQGVADVRSTAAMAGRAVGCRESDVLIASTGVIGEPLPVDRVQRALAGMESGSRSASWIRAARAIGTTDTYPKGAVRQVRIGDTEVSLCGIAKGSGMIAPDMATMLAFVFTDARLPTPVLRTLLKEGIRTSFNCITVDSDTSTSDTVLLAATGRALNGIPQSATAPELKAFRGALKELLTDLAIQVVRDGEGASKFITVDVSGAASNAEARKAALAIANSPLVKTAIAGEDANWGRIIMAVGKSGARLFQKRLAISIGGITITHAGERVGSYDERKVTKHLKGTEISIAVDLGVGRSKSRVWTCDLTHDYIRINADYRT